MTRKLWLWIAAAAVLGGFSLYLNKDWFAKDDIHIFHRVRSARTFFFRRSKNPNAPVPDVVAFGINRTLKLTSVKVIPVSEIETNKYPHPIWHLVSDSNSVPVKQIIYGMNIRGMRPSVKGAIADPLQPGVPYRLLIEADKLKAQHDFALAPPAQ